MNPVFALIVSVVFCGTYALARDCPELVGTLVVELPPETCSTNPIPSTELLPASEAQVSKLTEAISVRHAAADGSLGVAVHSAGIVVFDLSDPSQPQVTGYSPEEAWTAPAWSPPRCVAASGHYAFVCDSYNEQLVVFDLSVPEAVEPVAYVPARDVNDITIYDSLAYVAGQNFQIVDISDPVKPVQLGTVPTGTWRSYVAVEYPFAYVTGWTEGLFVGLTVIDVSDPSNPVTVGEAFRGELYCCGPVAVADSIVYVADSPVEDMSYLNVVDASDPRFPQEVQIEDWISARSLEVFEETLLVSSGSHFNPPVESVSEYDISTLGQLEVVGHQEIPRGNITAAGDLALIASGESGVQIVRPCGNGPRIVTDDRLRPCEDQ